jgi:hypothetical protein
MKARARVHCAQVQLDAAEKQLAARWQPLAERISQHRLSLLIGGGLLGGLALTAVPTKLWARIGAALFGGSAWIARSAIGPAVFGALWTSIQSTRVRERAPAPPCPVIPSV